MKFNRENSLPGLAQPSADLQVRRSGPVQAVQPKGRRSRLQETVADVADDEGLLALGPSDTPCPLRRCGRRGGFVAICRAVLPALREREAGQADLPPLFTLRDR